MKNYFIYALFLCFVFSSNVLAENDINKVKFVDCAKKCDELRKKKHITNKLWWDVCVLGCVARKDGMNLDDCNKYADDQVQQLGEVERENSADIMRYGCSFYNE